MEIVEVPESEKEIYNNFVMNQQSGSFLQGWDWGIWQENLGRRAHRFFVKDDENVIASLQLIEMPLFLGKIYLYAPYGPVVDLRFKILDLRFIKQELQRKFGRAVFIRIEPKFQLPATGYPLLAKTSNIQPAKTLIIDLSKSEEQLLAEMHHKTRYNIKLAQKHGVEVKDEFGVSVGNGLYAKEAVGLIVKTSERQDYKGYGFGYYEKMINCLAVHNRGDLKLHIYKAIYQGKLLSSAIIIDFPATGGSSSGGGTRTFLFGGSSDEHKNVMAAYLMHFSAMKDAKAAGLNFYDFWGIETSKGEVPGFVRFKLGFGGETIGYGGAYDIILKEYWYRLYRLLRVVRQGMLKAR